MICRMLLAAACAALLSPALAVAQPVEVTALAAPDLFSTAGRDTGLPADLWRGASAETLRAVLPLVASKPLSPAAQALGRRVLATGARGPDGAGNDMALAGARASALAALGDREAASTILSRTSGVERDGGLSRASAEAALYAGDDDRACAVSNALTVGRQEVYWLRLRAYCELRAGNTGAAQLTFDLAQAAERNAVYGRLMGVKLAGGGDPGAASSKTGLEYALSRSLGLNPPPPPGVAPEAGADTLDVILGDVLGERAVVDAATLDKLLAQAAGAEAKARPRLQAAALMVAALGAPVSPQARGELAKAGGEAKAPAGRALALDLAGQERLMGETALLALWISAEAGAAGPALGDRVRIVRALRLAGLEGEARAFAAEGLAAGK